MRLANFVEAVDVRRAEGDLSRGDLVEIALKNFGRQVGAFAAVGREPHALGQVGDRVEVRHDPVVGKHPAEAHRAVDPSRCERVGQGRRANELQCCIDAAGYDLADLRCDQSGVDQHVVDAVIAERSSSVSPAGGGQDGRADVLRECGSDQAKRRGATANQHGLTGLQFQSGGQRTIGRLQRLRYGAEDLPGQVGVERDHAGAWDNGVFGVAAVEGAAHAAHHRGHLLPELQVAVRYGVDDADAFDAQHTREGHAFGQAKTGVQLGSVEAKRLDLDADPPRLGFGNRQLADLQVLYRSWCAEHHCFHAHLMQSLWRKSCGARAAYALDFHRSASASSGWREHSKTACRCLHRHSGAEHDEYQTARLTCRNLR